MHRWPTTPIDVDRVRAAGELDAERYMMFAAAFGGLILLLYTILSFGVLLLVFGFIAAARAFAEWMALAHLRAGGVRVSREQYPELDTMADNFAGRMGIARPEIFVVQQTLWNAFAARLVGSDVVVLYSGAIDALLMGGHPEDVGFLLGHELGHHAAGHLRFRHTILRMALMVPFLPAYHRRLMELSCDRLALAAVGDADIALRGALSMTVGTTMAGRTSIAAARAQWDQVRRQAGVTISTLYSWYPHPLWRIDNLCRSAEAFGLAGPSADILPPPQRPALAGAPAALPAPVQGHDAGLAARAAAVPLPPHVREPAAPVD